MVTAPPKRSQYGVALLTVLLVVFLATIAATALATVQQVIVRRSTLLYHQEQARLYALGAEQWAAVILARDRTDGDTDHLLEEWATIPPALPVEGGSLVGRIEDLQGRFNINNLVKDGTIDDVQVQVLQRLLEALELDPGIAQATVDWIDEDEEVTFPDGAEDGDYVAHDPPYRAANRPLVSVSELRLVKGVDLDAYTKLAPYLSALPEFTQINVNTVSPPVLAAVLATEADPPNLSRAETLVEDRPADGYSDLDEFFGAAQIDGASPLVKDSLDVASKYFLVDVEANVGDGRALLASVLQRSSDGTSRVLVRNYGRDD